MRTSLFASLAAAAVCFAALSASAAAEQFPDHGDNPNPALFAKDARPYGKDMATWAERASQWLYGQPVDRSPLFDPTGANCAVDQRGPVWYIARIAGPPVFSGERWCTIPHSKSLLLYIGAVVNTYPCPPEFGFEPAPGQSLYDFLAAGAKAGMDLVDHLEVSLDGAPLNGVMDYRYVSDDLFSITGDPTLRVALDPCITGSPQPAVVDGFFMMFKPLERGLHTIRVHGTATPIGHDKTFVYHLTIE
jgi:hypothetical protein